MAERTRRRMCSLASENYVAPLDFLPSPQKTCEAHKTRASHLTVVTLL